MTSQNKETPTTRSISIMGIRGLPARHGGFETFAAHLAPFLKAHGWDVTVYCQEDGHAPVRESMWNGIRRVHIAVGPDTALGTVKFDWACVSHALRDSPSMVLTLGYNTALFGVRLRLAGIPNVLNMDGIEWSRAKWSLPARAWLYANDWAGCISANHLVADHPEIARHLQSRVARRKITTIPYGAEFAEPADPLRLAEYGLEPGKFVTVIARPEPENSILEIVEAFSKRRRDTKLVVLGNFFPSVPYHQKVRAAASDEVVFLGAIYEREVVQALRQFSCLYVHGHKVGGTNPSLLEAMGAGNPILAQDNPFNRWVADDGADYFGGIDSCAQAFDRLIGNETALTRMADASALRARETFNWTDVLGAYVSLLDDMHVWAHGRPSWPRLPNAFNLKQTIHD